MITMMILAFKKSENKFYVAVNMKELVKVLKLRVYSTQATNEFKRVLCGKYVKEEYKDFEFFNCKIVMNNNEVLMTKSLQRLCNEENINTRIASVNDFRRKFCEEFNKANVKEPEHFEFVMKLSKLSEDKVNGSRVTDKTKKYDLKLKLEVENNGGEE